MKLTDKQKRFCEEYLIDFNSTQSAIRAGYSKKTAGSIGSENLKKPEIQEYIKKLQDKTSERLQITRESLLIDLQHLHDLALEQDRKELNNAIKAKEIQGKIIGAYTENINHSGEMNINVNLIDD